MKEWLALKEVARAVGVSVTTVRRAVKRGELLASRVGPRLFRVNSEDMRNWVVRDTPKTQKAQNTSM